MSGTTRFEPSLVQIGRTVRPVAFPKKPKKEKDTPRQWQTGYSPRPSTSPYRSQSLHAGWPPVCSSIFQVLLKSVQWFCRCGWSKIALSHYFGQWLIQQLVYYRTSRDISATKMSKTCLKKQPLSLYQELRLSLVIACVLYKFSQQYCNYCTSGAIEYLSIKRFLLLRFYQ